MFCLFNLLIMKENCVISKRHKGRGNKLDCIMPGEMEWVRHNF